MHADAGNHIRDHCVADRRCNDDGADTRLFIRLATYFCRLRGRTNISLPHTVEA
jgi:hypothetical protein